MISLAPKVKQGTCPDCRSKTYMMDREYVSDPGKIYEIEACPKCSYRRGRGWRSSDETEVKKE